MTQTIIPDLAPGEGIALQGVSNETYHTHTPGVSSSMLKHDSMYAYWYHHVRDDREPSEPTKAMLVGSVVHALACPAGPIEDEYRAMPDLNLRTKAGKAERDQLIADHPGVTWVPASDWALAQAMFDALANHPKAWALLNATNVEYEHSLFWRDERTELLMKCRPDFATKRFCADLKTTSGSLDQDTIFREIKNWNYHLSAAHYLDGVRVCQGRDHERFLWVFVSKTPPHEVAVYQCPPVLLERGRLVNKAKYHEIADAYARNAWAPINDGAILEVDVPPWQTKQWGLAHE